MFRGHANVCSVKKTCYGSQCLEEVLRFTVFISRAKTHSGRTCLGSQCILCSAKVHSVYRTCLDLPCL